MLKESYDAYKYTVEAKQRLYYLTTGGMCSDHWTLNG